MPNASRWQLSKSIRTPESFATSVRGMEGGKLSTMGQITLATLLSLTIYSVLVFWIAVAQVTGGPDLPVAFVATLFVLVGVILLPLIWWGQKAGFLGALGVGVFGVIANILGAVGAFGELASEALIAIIPAILINLVLAGSSWRAWRE